MLSDHEKAEVLKELVTSSRLERLAARRASFHDALNRGKVDGNTWTAQPLKFTPAEELDTEAMIKMVNTYFSSLAEREELPLLNGFAGALGFDSFSHMLRFAQDGDTTKRRIIARGLLAIATVFEDQVLRGNRNAWFLLERIPHIDPGLSRQVPSTPFAGKETIVISSPDQEKVDLISSMAPVDAYLSMIKNRSITNKAEVKKEAALMRRFNG